VGCRVPCDENSTSIKRAGGVPTASVTPRPQIMESRHKESILLLMDDDPTLGGYVISEHGVHKDFFLEVWVPDDSFHKRFVYLNRASFIEKARIFMGSSLSELSEPKQVAMRFAFQSFLAHQRNKSLTPPPAASMRQQAENTM
jgi:hypothetical protein